MNLRTSGPWHYLADESEYFLRQPSGSPPSWELRRCRPAESMRKFIPEADQVAISDTWYYHDLHFLGCRSTAGLSMHSTGRPNRSMISAARCS